MEKEEYAQMKVRQAIVEKLETIPLAEMNLVAALEDYIVSGDRSLFAEYNRFRKVADTEQRAKVMELRLTDAQKRLAETQKEAEHIEEEITKQVRINNETIAAYYDMVEGLRNTVLKEYPQADHPTIDDLNDFIQRCIKEKPNSQQRKLWLKEGDKLRSVTAILFDGNKAVIEAGDPTTTLLTSPTESYQKRSSAPILNIVKAKTDEDIAPF